MPLAAARRTALPRRTALARRTAIAAIAALALAWVHAGSRERRRRSVSGLGRRALPLRGSRNRRPPRRGRPALPGGRRSRQPGRRLRRRPAQLRRPEVQRRGRVRDRVGLLRRRLTASSGRSRDLQPTRPATCTWSTRATTGSRSSIRTGTFITSWGHKGSALGDFNFGSSLDYTKPPGGGIAVAGNYVYVADSGNDRVERFNLSGEEPIQWGSLGSAAGQFAYPRGVAANEGEVLVTDDNHRVQRFDPNGGYLALRRSRPARARDSSPSPTASRSTRPATSTSQTTSATASSSSARSSNFLGAWGGYGSKPGQLAFPRALASDPAGDTYVGDTANDRIEVFDPVGELPAHRGHLGEGTRAAHDAAWARRRRGRTAVGQRPGQQQGRGVRPPQRRHRGDLDGSGRQPAGPLQPGRRRGRRDRRRVRGR